MSEVTSIREDYEKEFIRLKGRAEREIERLTEEKTRSERELLLQIELLERETRHLRSWNDELARHPGMVNMRGQSQVMQREAYGNAGQAVSSGPRRGNQASLPVSGGVLSPKKSMIAPSENDLEVAWRDLQCVKSKIDTMLDKLPLDTM